MDPVSTALIAGLAAGVARGVTDVGQKLIVDAYKALKGALQQKFGIKSDLVEAVEHLEKKPEAKGRQTDVADEVKAAQADQVPEVREAAEALLAALQSTPAGRAALSKYQVNVQGDVGIIGDHTEIKGDFRVGGSKDPAKKP
jgi:hypothetical protein